jgi:DNA-binding NarL/FixJ family response regulator
VPDPIRSSLDGDVDAASTAWAEIGSPYARADALSQGDAAQCLEALQIFEELGAVAAARLLRENLHNQGVTIPRGPSTATRSHRAGLTTRQAEVLSLLAEGLSNAAIADRLFLSTRTVEHHVAAVIGKLDVTNRDDAVETARREGYLPAGEEPS